MTVVTDTAGTGASLALIGALAVIAVPGAWNRFFRRRRSPDQLLVMRRAIVTAVVGIGLCLAVFAAPAAAAPRELFGISKGQPLDQRDFGKMKSTGVRTFRFALNWSFVQPHPGAQELCRCRQARGQSRRSGGFDRFRSSTASPHWVAKKPNQPPLGSSKKVQAWRHFLTLVVNRYGPGGDYWTATEQHPGVKPKPITAWQIWNEPTLPKFFPDITRRESTGSS